MKAEGKRRRGPSKYRKWADPDERNRAYAAARRARRRNQFVEHVEPSVVFERDGGVCGICHEPVSPDDFHVDHVVPLVRGGEHSYANVQVAHPSCNCRKKDRVDFRIDTGESASAAA